MPKITENLRDAQILADFSNLEPAQEDYFRNNYPDFAPQDWWDYQSGEFPEKQWRVTQNLLREGWKDHFKSGPYYLVALLTSVFDPANMLGEFLRKQRLPKGFFVKNTAESYTVVNTESHTEIRLPPRRAFATVSELSLSGYIPLQRAASYLFESSWRARFCAECNKRFVAAQPKNKFCGDECRMNHRTRQKLEWRHEHSKAWRNRFCAECNKPFVATEPKSKFCSDLCRVNNRKRQKRKWFRKHGKQWRKRRRRGK